MLSSDEITMLAYALEYESECSDEIYAHVNKILDKIENNLNIDTPIGNRISEYGKSMGWNKEQ